MRTRYLAQFLRLRAAFHTLPLFCYERKIYVRTLRVDLYAAMYERSRVIKT